MKKIQAQPLTPEAFRNYGTYQNMLDFSDRVEAWEDGRKGFFADLLQINLGKDNAPSFSINRVGKEEGNVINFTEFHRYTAEGILALDGDCIFHVGKAQGAPGPDKLKAFILPRGTLVTINPGVLHGTHIAHKEDWVNVLIILPERTYGNDCEVIPFSDDQKIEVLY